MCGSTLSGFYFVTRILYNHVSFADPITPGKQCEVDIPEYERVECGYDISRTYNLTAALCEWRDCCYNETSTPSCYFKASKLIIELFQFIIA